MRSDFCLLEGTECGALGNNGEAKIFVVLGGDKPGPYESADVRPPGDYLGSLRNVRVRG